MKINKTKYLIKSQGFSIIELMIAILIGLIVLTGLVTVFDSSSRMNRAQNGLARIQENGRYAISLLKQQISQAGFQHCAGSAEENNPNLLQPQRVAWNLGSGAWYDSGYMVFGHECTGGTCTPNLTTDGADPFANVPVIGTGDGQRIEGTDVITVRYLTGGRDVAATDLATNQITLRLSSTIPTAGQVLVIGCGTQGIMSPQVFDVSTSSLTTITTVTAPPILVSNPLMKVYNLPADFFTATYYVANNIVDGHSIPTLYGSFNGTINPIIEGVDAFDLVYGTKDIAGNMQFLTATEVQDMAPANCWRTVKLGLGASSLAPTIPATPGCGWRSVVSVEVHMLLNTVYNSSNSTVVAGDGSEPFRYSLRGNAFQNPQSNTALPSDIPHYNMHRKEFFTAIALKNIMQ